MSSRYKVYPEYRNSGVEWLESIPSHWEIKKLKFIANVQPSNVDKKTKEGEISVLLCNYTDVYYNDSVDKSIGFMKASATKEQIDKFTLKAGDIIITKDSEDPTDIAIPTFVPEDIPGVVCGYHLSIIRTFKNEYSAYIKRVFESNYANAYFTTRSNGLTRYGLGTYPLENVYFPKPSEDEAIFISNFLNHETAKIDTLIEKQRQLIKLLKEKRQAVISHAITKGLNPDAPMKDSGVEWLGDVPEHWKIQKAQFIFEEQNRHVRDVDGIVTVFRDGQVCLRSRRRETGFTMAILEHGYQGIRKGDLVLHSMDAFAGAIGVSEDDGRSTPEYVVIKPFNNRMNCEYYAKILRLMAKRNYIIILCPSVRERAPRFRFSKFKQVLLPVPPNEEQDEIIDYISSLISKYDVLSLRSEHQIELLKERRTALISAAVTGKIDVRDWKNPGDIV